MELFERLMHGFGDRSITEIGLLPLAVMLVISVMAAIFIAYLYITFYSGRGTGSEIHRSFPLLGISVTAIFVCIQFSLPLSLGLLGALSIVRFRTPIKEPEEIGFLMLVIAASLAVATFNFPFLAILLVIALVALLLKRLAGGWWKGRGNAGMVVLTLSETEYGEQQAALLEALRHHLPKGRLESLHRGGGEVVLSYHFRAFDAERAVALEGHLKDRFTMRQTSVLLAASGLD